MVTKSTSVLVRLEPQVKEDAEAVFEQMGLSMSTAINIFLKQVIRTNKIPFEISAGKSPKAVEDMGPDELNAGLEESLEQMRAGKVVSLEEAMDVIRRRLDRWAVNTVCSSHSKRWSS